MHSAIAVLWRARAHNVERGDEQMKHHLMARRGACALLAMGVMLSVALPAELDPGFPLVG